MNLAKLVSLSIALLLIQACSHPIEIVGEGDVESASGNRNCSLEQFTAADPVCSKNYAIGAYQETYNPVPRSGWQFDHWGNYCASSTPPTYDCSFDYTAATVRKFWGATVPPLQAVFTPLSGTPITDTVTANGKVWAQADLFENLSWNDINAVCPAGVCAGTLNGHDMTGWTWASIEDVNALYNVVLLGTGCTLGTGSWPATGDCRQVRYTFEGELMDDLICAPQPSFGFRPTLVECGGAENTNWNSLKGHLRDIQVPGYETVTWRAEQVTYVNHTSCHAAQIYPYNGCLAIISTNVINNTDTGSDQIGAWFFRAPLPPVDTDGDGLADNVDPCPLNPASLCAPITGTDIVFANGREWAQLDLFTNLSSTQVLAVCPAGICVDGGVLNGHDMTGWRLATVADVDALINRYTGTTTLTPDTFTNPGLLWSMASTGQPPPGWLMSFFTDFRYTFTDPINAPGHGKWTGFALASPYGAVDQPATIKRIQLSNCTSDPGCAGLFQSGVLPYSYLADVRNSLWMIRNPPVGGYPDDPFGVIDQRAVYCARVGGVVYGLPYVGTRAKCCGSITVVADSNGGFGVYTPPNPNLPLDYCQ